MKKKTYEVDEQQLNNEATTPAPEESKKHKVISTIVNVVLVIAIIVAALATYTSYVNTSGNGMPSLFGVSVFSIQTESMYPTLKPGDLIIDKVVKDAKKLEKGDVITYWTVINGERVLNTHRISQIYDGGDHLIFETKGDNNTISDSLTVHESEVVGIFSSRIAGVGKVVDYLQTSTGFLIVVVVPVFLFFLYYLIQFFRVLFEYQNVKNRIKYEQERGRTEDFIDEEKRKAQESHQAEREALEAELREKLRAEMLAEMQKKAGENGEDGKA
ncbi:MAG: signal peptidase I [Oscillospiraceae bacterium]|nr:signal peptidase I [Oscillospiraceae bacterium]